MNSTPPPQAILCFIRPRVKQREFELHFWNISTRLPDLTTTVCGPQVARQQASWPVSGGGEVLLPSWEMEALSLCKLSSCGNSSTALKINGITWRWMGKANCSATQGLSPRLGANCRQPLQWGYLPENIPAVSWCWRLPAFSSKITSRPDSTQSGAQFLFSLPYTQALALVWETHTLTQCLTEEWTELISRTRKHEVHSSTTSVATIRVWKPEHKAYRLPFPASGWKCCKYKGNREQNSLANEDLKCQFNSSINNKAKFYWVNRG